MAVFLFVFLYFCPCAPLISITRKIGRADRQGWPQMGGWAAGLRRRWRRQELLTDESSYQPATYSLRCISNCISCNTTTVFLWNTKNIVLHFAISYHQHQQNHHNCHCPQNCHRRGWRCWPTTLQFPHTHSLPNLQTHLHSISEHFFESVSIK